MSENLSPVEGIDLNALTDDDLAWLQRAVTTEICTRRTLATAPQRAEAIAAGYLAARDGSVEIIDPDTDRPTTPETVPAWVQPTGAHDAYPRGTVTAHDEKWWVSLIPANVWEPGVSGWRALPDTTPGNGAESPAEWVQPTGAHDAYQTGDRVTFSGQVWVSIIDSNVWAPPAYPQGWMLVD